MLEHKLSKANNLKKKKNIKEIKDILESRILRDLEEIEITWKINIVDIFSEESQLDRVTPNI